MINKRFKATVGKSLHIGESLRHIELKMTGKKDTSSKRVSYFRNGHQRRGRIEFLTKSYYFANLTVMEIDGTRRQEYEAY